MQFQFIDSANIDANARKQIRSSVMMGRNVGKKRQRKQSARPAKQRFLLPDIDVARRSSSGSCSSMSSSGAAGPEGNNTDGDNQVARILGSVGNEWSSVSFPRPMEPYMQKIITQFMQMTTTILYPKELCIPIADSHAVWFEYLQQDEAFFHCLLAMAQAHSDWLIGLKNPHQRESLRTLKYLGNTYRCVNENLKQQKTPSDSTVAVVMSITMHNNILRAPIGAEPHLNALQRMVEMRGGIEQFEAPCRMLLHKICRTDLEYSLQRGTRPRFYRDEFPYSTLQSMKSWNAYCYQAFVTTTSSEIYDIEIQSVMRDLLCTSRFLDTKHNIRPQLEPFAFQELLISVCYRLVCAHPLGEEPPSSVPENACQLGMLAVVTTILIRGNHAKVPYPLLSGLFKSAVERLIARANTHQQFLLWCLFMGGISVWLEEEEGWLFPALRRCTSILKLDSWEAAKSVLADYPWIQYFHDASGEKLWNDAVTE
ncbi:hypothetical protein H072_1586 [Dactylellina haptotyla CBS 200.50]|uniref:Uncharacterized protein n=1 Tax=Dactylellina haptotyla (strain CBS 200.50) TaxID=1284197 RepID=S8ATU6_DACHA|nr:hypothetical protein H072_1586 [Dactylellina haptotyla CBS 200.50]